MNNQNLPMRDGVGVIILNKNDKVFVGKRKDNPGNNWQMPQGGVDEGEDYITAMKRELFGPIVTIYLYKDQDFDKTLQLIDSTSDYALTGSIFSKPF